MKAREFEAQVFLPVQALSTVIEAGVVALTLPTGQGQAIISNPSLNANNPQPGPSKPGADTLPALLDALDQLGRDDHTEKPKTDTNNRIVE